MHYYQHHIGDFTKDTANLNDHQVATYLRMIWLYYTDEHPLTIDMEDLAFLVRSEAATVRLLCKHYFIETLDGWRHARCDREIAVVGEKSEKARFAAEKRWNNANAMRTHTESDANASKNDATQHPTPNTQHPIPKNTVESMPRATRLAPEWEPDEKTLAWQKKERPELDPARTIERFRDFWTAKPGKDGLKLDWTATFRNWVRSERAPAGAVSTPRSFREIDNDAAAQRVAKFAPRVAVKSGSVNPQNKGGENVYELE
jgi:uncharacterized protein YdaU (DUF1376 family)